MSNILEVTFESGQTFATAERLWKGDYGQVLLIHGPELPAYYEVHFSSTKDGTPEVSVGTPEGVNIPNRLLQAEGHIYAWVFLHAGQNDGETKFQVKIPVEERGIPVDQETPEDQTAVQQAIAALNAETGRADAAADAAEVSEQNAKASEDAAALSEQNAEDAAQAAAASAENAAISETGAAESEAAAAASAQEAAASAAAAAASAAEAGGSEQTIAEYARQAGEAADTALQYGVLAVQSAQEAAASAQEAATYGGAAIEAKSVATQAAATATQKAQEASTNAGIAASHAATAVSKATEAVQSANEAAQSAADAADSAEDADDSAASARLSNEQAQAASTAAQTAAGNASTAQTAAEAAQTAAETAQDGAEDAQDAAEAAQSSAEAAQTAAEAAKTAAQTAQGAAEAARDAAESAAQSISQSAAQIQQNTEDISQLKSEIVDKKPSVIPGSFAPVTGKADLSLSGYTGKKIAISNRNLLPQFTQMTDHGVTCVKNDDGSISLSGTADGVAVITITTNDFTNLGPGTYALSCGNSEAIGDSNTYINVAINGSYAAIYARFNSVDGKTTFTVPDGSIATGIRIRIPSGVVIPENFKCYPQITEGSDFLDFIPHEGKVISPTSGTLDDIDVFEGYTYIGAQSGVSGTVTYDVRATDVILDRIESLESVAGRFIGKKIVCFGDSIFANFQEPYDIPSMLETITGATVYNAAFGGCCMSDNDQARKLFTMCRLVDAIVAGDFTAQKNSGVSITYAGTSINYVPDRLAMMESIDWSEIDYITISYGTNDWNSNYALDNENDPDDVTTYLGAFRYSVEKLLTAYPNIKILPITPLWRFWDTNTGMPSEVQGDYIDSNTYAKGTGYKLWEYGDALIEAAKDYQIPVFDIYHVCMMNKFNRHQYFETTDGTHPKLEGRVMMSSMIAGHLNATY